MYDFRSKYLKIDLTSIKVKKKIIINNHNRGNIYAKFLPFTEARKVVEYMDKTKEITSKQDHLSVLVVHILANSKKASNSNDNKILYLK